MIEIAISSLQHYLFCPRQAALIHQEGCWRDNLATVQGRLMHQRVHRQRQWKRRPCRHVTGLWVGSASLGLFGQCDLVELNYSPEGEIVSLLPVEHKRGRPKLHRADEVQLCAQALCLEEELALEIPQGMIYYHAVNRRHLVTFDQTLRQLCRESITGMRQLLIEQQPPPARYRSSCRQCSLVQLCLPRMARSTQSYRQRHLKQALADNSDVPSGGEE